jgi:DNA repair protein RadC
MNAENQKFTIKQWDANDRPREKMILKGKHSLSDAELIAILIRSGNRQESAVSLSKKILAHCHQNLGELALMSAEQLSNFKGIGQAKALSILTALELGRRTRFERRQKTKIESSKDVFELVQPRLGALRHEEFWVLYLNNSNDVLSQLQLSKGGLTGTLVDARLLLKKALDLLATGVVLCHNHPSGSTVPSQADKNITRKIKRAAAALDIKVLDHLIVTENSYFSFADAQIL